MRNENMTFPQARPRSLAARRSGGFTLIELLLVLVILAVLAALVVPRITGRGKEAKVTTAKQGISNIKTALKMFEMNCDRFPTSEEGLRALIEPPGNLPGWKGPYLDQQSVPLDPWQQPYMYRCPGQHSNDFDLYSYGPDMQDGGDDDIDNWSQPVPR
jgi:general secretion pathway protein G